MTLDRKLQPITHGDRELIHKVLAGYSSTAVAAALGLSEKQVMERLRKVLENVARRSYGDDREEVPR